MTVLTPTAPGSYLRRPRPEPERRVVERRRVDGTVIDTVALDPTIFGQVPNVALLHQVITAQLAASRAGTQSTRTRAEVSGGGAKPFRQKGTGRARQGSTRSPQWSGGGVALGPKPRSYRQRTPKKMIRLALYSALSDRAAEGRVAVVDEWSFAVPRTKDAVAALGALGVAGRVLVVLGPDDGIPDRSFANLPMVQTMQDAELNAYDVMKSDWVVFTDATLPGETTAAPGEEAVVARPARPPRARKAPTPKARVAPAVADEPEAPQAPDASDESGDVEDAADDASDQAGAGEDSTGDVEHAADTEAGPDGEEGDG